MRPLHSAWTQERHKTLLGTLWSISQQKRWKTPAMGAPVSCVFLPLEEVMDGLMGGDNTLCIFASLVWVWGLAEVLQTLRFGI